MRPLLTVLPATGVTANERRSQLRRTPCGKKAQVGASAQGKARSFSRVGNAHRCTGHSGPGAIGTV